MPRPPLISALPLLLLAACATPTPGSGRFSTTEGPDRLSSYGLYLAGEAALNDGKSAEAGRLFDLALARPDIDPVVGERAFTAALLSGDVSRAAALAPNSADASEATQRMGRLVVAVEAMARGRGKQAHEILTSNIGFPHDTAAVLLAPWAAAQAGDVEGSLVRPQARGDRVLDYFGLLGQGRLFERAKRYDEAETDFKAAMGLGVSAKSAILTYGGFLERRGRRLDAVALYDTALSEEPSDPTLLQSKARAADGGKAPQQPTLLEGASEALLAPSAAMVAAKQTQIALAYVHMVLRLDPARDDAWLLVGDMMQSAGDLDRARAAYLRPKPGSEEYAAAQGKLAWTYENAGDHEAALKMARAAAVSGGPEARLTLADLLRANKHYPEAVELISGVLKEQATPNWRLLYMRGVTLHQMDRWPEAEKDLTAALAAQPDEPELLNYLGYSWIDRGERLKEALGMVERAVAAVPGSGAMIDSLGWAHYRLGNYTLAVEKLEEAVSLEAGDPEVNDHLGDAYWKVGRKDEAVFQWRRVLTLNPDEKIKAGAEAKLASKLGPDGPAKKLAGQ